MSDSLYIVMPTYNEEANIENVIRMWYPLLEGKDQSSRLVVADSGSTDRTHEILTGLCEELPQLEILPDTNKLHGPKCIALYNLAIKRGIDYVFQTDSDGQTDPADFEKFWEKREEYSAIFGHRNIRGDGKVRAFVEKVVVTLVRLYFGVSVPDANAPFRLMTIESLKKYVYRLPADYYLPNIMLTTFYAYYGESIRFEKISFTERAGGENKVDMKSITRIGWNALGEFRDFKRQMKQDKP